MPFLIANVMDIGKNIEAIHQKDILEISQHKNKIELSSSHEIERSLLYLSIFMRIFQQKWRKNRNPLPLYYYFVEIAIL